MDKDCFKTPPNMVNSNHAKQGHPKNDNSKISIPLPTKTQSTSLSQSPSSSQRPAATPKRIINRIPLDFSKLKQAGLDRKLAEVLSKQNLHTATKIASASTTNASSSTSNSASSASDSASVAPPSTETPCPTQVQRQNERPTAAQPNRKKTSPNLVAVDEQSLHIKALIKNKILNKMARSPTATTTTTSTTTTSNQEVSPVPSSSLTVPIAKADLTPRPKLLLNLVNQLPKHRAMCGVSSSPQTKTRAQETPAQSKAKPQLKARSQLKAVPQPKQQPRQQQTQPAARNKPLIVLENKVLAPNEKIDLRALRLPKMHTTIPEPISMPEPAKTEPPKTAEHGQSVKSTARILQLPPTTPGSGAKKFILNANKLKVPREQLAQLAKNIKENSMQQLAPSGTTPTEAVQASSVPKDNQTTSSPPVAPHVAEVQPKLQSVSPAQTPTGSSNTNNVISAVDFIAQLKHKNSLDMSSYANLSAEELSMKALFNDFPTAAPEESKAAERTEEVDELPIGKILQMEDMDILHATMNVDENETNVLCISPNAIKLEKSIKTSASQPKSEGSSLFRGSSPSKKNESLLPSCIKSNPTPTFLVTAPPKAENPQTSQQETSVITVPAEAEKHQTPQQDKPVITAPPEAEKPQTYQREKPVKEVTRPPFRPKKGKINLVQRNKRNSVGKSSKTEAIKAEEVSTLIDEPVDNTVAEIQFDLDREIEAKIIENIEKPSNESKPIIESSVAQASEIHKKLIQEQNNKDAEKEPKIEEINKQNMDSGKEKKINNNIETKQEVQEKLNKKRGKSLNEEGKSETENKKRKTDINVNQEIVSTEPTEQTVNNELSKEFPEKQLTNELVRNIESDGNLNSEKSEENTEKFEIQPQKTMDVEVEKKNFINRLKTTKDTESNVENKIELETKNNQKDLYTNQNVEEIGLELQATEESKVAEEYLELPSSTNAKRDLSQLYHPPKMPKSKQKLSSCNKEISTELSTSVSLLEVLSQEEQTPQREPQLPFRSDSKAANLAEKKPHEVMGIQNLVDKLTAENVIPTSQQSKEIGLEEATKVPRKKLVKTRPVLSAKRAAKTVPAKKEALHPRKRALLAETQTDSEAHRVPTSSTSDDDMDVFCGFDIETAAGSKSVTNLKATETDISDDATPDYDETEEDAKPQKATRKKKSKTEPNLEAISEEKPETETAQEPAPVVETHAMEETISEVPLEPTVVKRKRGRPAKKPAENAVNKTEETKTEKPLTRKRKRSNASEALEDSSTAPADSASLAEEMPARKRTRKSRKSSAEPDTASEALEDSFKVPADAVSLAEETPVRKRPRKSSAELERSEVPEETTVKRAGRRKKITSESIIESTPDSTVKLTPTPLVTSTPGDTITPKKRGRKPKFSNMLALSTNETTENNPENAEKLEELCKLEPGCWPSSPDFNLRLLLIRRREQLEGTEELREEGQGKGTLQCGLCLVRCEPNDWVLHLKEHYGVGWTINKPPATITRGLVINMMINYVKGGHRLSCRLCERSFGSGLGAMLHLEGCGAKPERVECETCQRMYSKIFITQHSRTCFKRVLPTDTSAEETIDEDVSSTPVYSKAGRAKRRSTIKAETKMQKIAEQLKKPTGGKEFDGDSSDYDINKDKESSEEYESEGVDSNEEEANQSNDETSSICGDSSSGKKRRKKYKTSGATEIAMKLPGEKIYKPVGRTAEHWKDFVQKNYAEQTLYPHLLPQFEQLSPTDAIQMLPSRESSSMRYAYGNADEPDWQQLSPLESFNKKNEHICHLGKPVKELAWVPLPATVDAQYLLCSQRPKMHGFTRHCKDKQSDDLLLLLECTKVDKKKSWALQTRLYYGLHMNQGTVNSFAFMPSGGYDKSINRLALLAVGSTCGVSIYALPLEVSGLKDEPTVIELKELIKLCLDVEHVLRDPCTKICWSQASGHNLLVTGYATGNVAFWDIADEEGLNCFERNNQRHFLPSSYFYFGERNIQSLELHYDGTGARWLAVGAAVRKFWIYDISNWSQPLSILGDLIQNLYMGCITWSPLWESLMIGCSDLSRPQFMRVIALNLVDLSSSLMNKDVMLNSIRSMHFNCDQNVLASIADNGDVSLLSTNEFDAQSMLRRRTEFGPFGATEAYNLCEPTELKYVTPDVFQRDYGLLIRPLRMETRKEQRNSYQNPKRTPNFNLRTMMRLNCVRWNWNAHASSWVAIGAEHGLLRIINYQPDI